MKTQNHGTYAKIITRNTITTVVYVNEIIYTSKWILSKIPILLLLAPNSNTCCAVCVSI